MITRHAPEYRATSRPASELPAEYRPCGRCGIVRWARPEALFCQDCKEVMAHEGDPQDALFDDELEDEVWARGDGE